MGSTPSQIRPRTLPTPLTRFVGREAELARAAAMLADARLLTLTGAGGAGKTRLAVQLAAAVADQFPDGTWFIDFSQLSDGRFVWDQVAMTLGVKDPGGGGNWAETVEHFVARRVALLVVDNCEHLVESAAEVTNALLIAAPGLKVVATGREPLGVGGELTWSVPALSDLDGVELFTDRARLVRPDFSLRSEDADTVRSICRRLDGLPLAIELAAALTRALAPTRIAGQLQDHFHLLPGGPRTAPGRQATLRASFEWSYHLLTEAEQTLLRQLSVFTGGFDLDAALAVCPAARIDLLAALADRSLIMVDARSDLTDLRYRMLETVREFAGERLADAGELDPMRTRHRDHYLGLAEAAEPELPSPAGDRWEARLTGEQANLRAALAWSRDHGEAEALARMVVALTTLWLMSGRATEAEMWLTAAADRGSDLSPRLLARLRNCQCQLPYVLGRSFENLPALADEALALARACGDKREEAFALLNVGYSAGFATGPEPMRPYLEAALPLAREAGFVWGAVLALTRFVQLRWFQSGPEEPRRLAEEAIAVARAGGDRHLLLSALWVGGLTAWIEGRLTDADLLFQEAVADGRYVDDSAVWNAQYGLACVAMARGDFAGADSAIAESLAGARRSEAEGRSSPGIEDQCHFILGWMQLANGEAAQAIEVLRPLVHNFGLAPFPGWPSLALWLLAEAQLATGAHEDAAASLEQTASIARAAALTWVLGRAALVRAKLLAREGDWLGSEALVHQALSQGGDAGDRLGLVDAVEFLAELVIEQGSVKQGVRLLAAAQSHREHLGYSRFPADQAPHVAAIARARECLGDVDFAAGWAEGAKLSFEEAIAYAARGRGERKRPTTGWESLTPSELQVVRLVGEHLSNPEVAKRLFISRATVKSHLVHIFSKLGIDSRSELASEAAKRGLVRRPE